MKALGKWWRVLVREIVWILDLDDGEGAPSVTKILAVAVTVLAFLAVLRQLPVSGNIVLLIAMAISAAFGRSVWMRYLARGQWSLSGKDTTSTQRIDIRQTIRERRGEDGTEPAGKVPQAFDD